MNNKAITVILVVVVAVLLYYLFGRTPKDNTGTNSTRVEDSLRRVIGSYEDKQKIYDSTLNQLNNSIDSMEVLIAQNKKDITNLKVKLNEKNAAISKFSTTDIYKYLSNRYPQDSTGKHK